MSETRETTTADMDQAIPRLVGDIASSRAEDIVSFSQKHSRCECFCEKEKSVPRCRRRLHRYREETARLNAHRVTPVKDRSYAVTNPKGNFADGRAEETRSFSRHVGSKSQHVVKRYIKYHAAAGESGFHLVNRLV
jgi:hypothetical protein